MTSKLREPDFTKIDVAPARFSWGCGEVEHLINALEEKLSALLSARATGDITVQGKIDRIKGDVHRHQETLADAEPTYQGLKEHLSTTVDETAQF